MRLRPGSPPWGSSDAGPGPDHLVWLVPRPWAPGIVWVRPTEACNCESIAIGVAQDPGLVASTETHRELAASFRGLLRNTPDMEAVEEAINWHPDSGGQTLTNMEAVWCALRGAPWLPPGELVLRCVMSASPPFVLAGMGMAPQSMGHEGLCLAASGAAAIMLAIDAAEDGHDALGIVGGRRLPQQYDLRGAATMIQRLTTNPVAEDVPVFNMPAPARRATLTPGPGWPRSLSPRP